jgi:hypothetical protein
LIPVIPPNHHHRHLDRSGEISLFFIFNLISKWQFSGCQASVNAGFRPRSATSSFTRKEEARNLGQRLQPLGQLIVRFDNQQNNSFRRDCPRQSPLHSNKFCRLTEVVKADNTMSQELPHGHY